MSLTSATTTTSSFRPTGISSMTTTTSSSDLRVRLKNLLTSQKHSDCSFRIDKRIINSHKVILCTASPVFEAMFYGPMAETRCILITDITPETFLLLLEYIYTDDINMTNVTAIEDLLELYYAAKKYLLTVLQLRCIELIRSSLRHDNILRAIDMAVAMNIPELLDVTVGFFSKFCLIGRFFSNIVMQSNDDDAFHISKATLNCILASDIQQQNINLLCLIKKWCQREAKQQQLGPDDICQILTGVRVPVHLLDDLQSMHSLVIEDISCGETPMMINGLKNSRMAWELCQRKYYKAVRPLCIGRLYESSMNTSLRSNRLLALRSLIINSRLTPFIGTAKKFGTRAQPLARNYTEQINVVIAAGDNDYRLQQTFVVFNTEYNSTVSFVFEKAVIIAADVVYDISFRWSDCTATISGVGDGVQNNGCWEYPRSVLSPEEKIAGGSCTLEFDCSNNINDIGSILVGVEFVILS